MILIDSFNIIALELHTHTYEEDVIKLQFDQIFRWVDEIEASIPHVEVCCDMISLDAFRCEFDDFVRIEEQSMMLQNKEEFKQIMERFIPSEAIVKEYKQIQRK